MLRCPPVALPRAAARVPLGRPRSFAGGLGIAPLASTRAHFYYQGPAVPTSIWSTGRVGTYRDGLGSDSGFFGTDPTPVELDVRDGRGAGFTLDGNGFALVGHPWRHVDYYDQRQVVGAYYRECEALVCRETGASFAVAFDHNNRARRRKLAGESLAGGNAVQEPLISYGVHNDYTARSAPSRIRQLSEPLKRNDTIGWGVDTKPPIDPSRVDALLRGRWMFVNVWRNTATAPVARFPLGLIDASCVGVDDLVVFEIRYSDRTGENYFARHSPEHRWYYFPQLTRDEVVLLKCWDSRGRDFVEFMPGMGAGGPARGTVPATFSLHTGFDDPATPGTAPDRESIEVRVVAFFEDP